MIRQHRRIDCSLYSLLSIAMRYQFESGIDLVVAVQYCLDLPFVAQLHSRARVAILGCHHAGYLPAAKAGYTTV